MRCHPRNMHLPAPQMDEKEDVIRHQPAQRPNLGGEKVRRDQHIHVRTDTLLPGRRSLALWSRRNAMALKDVAHGLITDCQAQGCEGSDDPVIAPAAMLL